MNSETLKNLPHIVSTEANSADCKALLEKLPAPELKNQAKWKRLTKRVKGTVVERRFERADGLCALVSHAGGVLRISCVAYSIEELDRQSQETGLFWTHQAPAKMEQDARTRMAEFEASEDDEGYYNYVDEVAATPKGSAERLAFGALFSFQLPTEECFNASDEVIFSVVARANFPTPDHPHMLEQIFGDDKIESPNESCDHVIHGLTPADAVKMLLDAGFIYAPPAPDQNEMADYAKAMRPLLLARDESVALSREVPAVATTAAKTRSGI